MNDEEILEEIEEIINDAEIEGEPLKGSYDWYMNGSRLYYCPRGEAPDPEIFGWVPGREIIVAFSEDHVISLA